MGEVGGVGQVPAVGQRPGEAGAAEQGLRAAVSSGAGGRSPGGAGRGPGCESRCRLELGAGGVSSLGGRAARQRCLPSPRLLGTFQTRVKSGGGDCKSTRKPAPETGSAAGSSRC